MPLHLGRAPLDRRLHGVDAARALAILGMLAVHVGPTGDASLAGRLYALPHGRASLLFALVAGIGASLLAASPSRSRRTTRLTLLWRAGLLIPTGLALQALDHGVNVILQSYALLFLIASFAVWRSDRWLLIASGASALLGPVLVLAGQTTAPEVFRRDPLRFGDPLGEFVAGLVVSGPYPLVTWAAPFLLGVWLGRRDLRSRRFSRRAMSVGAAIAMLCLGVSELIQWTGRVDTTVSPGGLLRGMPHSQMPLWLVGGTASAVAVLGFTSFLARKWPGWTRPVAAAGTLALTLYVGHLLLLHAAPWLRSDDIGRSIATLAVASAVGLLASTIWHNHLGTGPLERLLRLPPRRP